MNHGLRAVLERLFHRAILLALSFCACRPAIPDQTWQESRLLAALANPDEDTRIRAAALLARQPTEAEFWPLVRALGDERWEVRASAAKGLARLGDNRAVIPVEHSLRDRHWWVRAEAAEALGQFGDARSAGLLRQAEGDENEAVKEAVAAAVAEVDRRSQSQWPGQNPGVTKSR